MIAKCREAAGPNWKWEYNLRYTCPITGTVDAYNLIVLMNLANPTDLLIELTIRKNLEYFPLEHN